LITATKCSPQTIAKLMNITPITIQLRPEIPVISTKKTSFIECFFYPIEITIYDYN
jgi:hypothetical protein